MEIRVRGVKKVTAKGRTYYYHRKTKRRIKADPEDPAAFVAEVKFLDGLRFQRDHKPNGLLGGLISAYKASPEFESLADVTRDDYQRVFDYLKPLSLMPLIEIDEAFLLGVRDKAYRKHKRRFSTYVLQVASLLFSWGKPRGWVKSNPATGLPRIKRKGKGRNRAWKLKEVRTAIDEAPEGLLVPIAIGAHTGLREGDVIKLPWSAYDGAGFTVKQSKTGDEIYVHASAELRKILDNTPRVSPIIVVGKRGRPYTANGFRARFFRFIKKLEGEGKVEPGLTFHGLRHTVGRDLGDAGEDTRTIADVLGHKTESMARHYSKEASQKRRAGNGIERLEQHRNRKWKTSRD